MCTCEGGLIVAIGILEGVDAVLDRWLKIEHIGSAPHYQHKAAARKLSDDRQHRDDPLVVITEVFNIIRQNWQAAKLEYGRPTSEENWRLDDPRSDYIDGNPSKEVTLERTIVRLFAEVWTNQIPPSSGLTGNIGDNRRHIDLGRRDNDEE
jgi:hypothetical protein